MSDFEKVHTRNNFFLLNTFNSNYENEKNCDSALDFYVVNHKFFFFLYFIKKKIMKISIK